MKEIKLENLEVMHDNYENDTINQIVRNALDNNSIKNIVKVKKEEQNVLYNFSINLDTLKVANQKVSGRCWIFAGCNVIREIIAKKYNLKDFELSQSYIAFYDKLERSNYIMNTLIDLKDRDIDDRERYHILTTGLEDGGQWDMFVNIVNKYGIVPKTVMDETYQSSNSSEVNYLLNRKIRQFASVIPTYEDDLISLKNLYLEDIYRILVDCYGSIPKVFDFEYTTKDKEYHIIKDLTPLKFYQDYSGIDLNDYISIINSPTKDKPFNKTYTVRYLGNVIEGSRVLYLNLDIDTFKEKVLAQLKDNAPVWFGSDCSKAFDREKGIFDDKLFNYNDPFKTDFTMDKSNLLDYYEAAMNHAMVLTGVNIENEVPTKWKIENSWGEEKGDKGYYVASASWFDKYVFQAVINKKYLTSSEVALLNEEPTVLKPWDPMGTLAK